MPSFRTVETDADVAEYEAYLAEGYPDRPAVVAHLVELIEALNVQTPAIAELCVGSGVLAEAIGARWPTCHYVGLDFKKPFLSFSAEKLPSTVHAAFVEADLRENAWPQQIAQHVPAGRLDAIVSFQSLHDVGDGNDVARVYRFGRNLLGANGVLINADLVTPLGEEATARGGRLTVRQHRDALRAAGFKETACTLQVGPFGVVMGSA